MAGNNTTDIANSSENESCEIAPSLASVIIIANVISTIVGGIGNSLVCLAVWKTTSLHSPINYYMASLAVADLIVTVVCQPLMVGVIVGRLTGDLDCDSTLDTVYRAIGNFSCASSFFLLCCISLERLLAILRPLTTIRSVNNRRFGVLVSLSWLIALLYSVLRVTVSRKWTSYFSAASFSLGYVWIISCYVIILVILTIQGKRQASLTISERTQRKNEKKITMTMVLVMGCFTVMWLPFFCFRLSSNSTLNSGVIYELAITMAFCNSSFNAIIYSFRNRKYRKAFKAVLFKKSPMPARGTARTTAHLSAYRKTSGNVRQASYVLKPMTSHELSQLTNSSKMQVTDSEGSSHGVTGSEQSLNSINSATTELSIKIQPLNC